MWSDLTDAGRLLASELGLRSGTFAAAVTDIDARTAQRLREGEMDHLVYYLLQSRSFTDAAAIEPARSALEHFASGTIPATVHRRIEDFARTLRKPADDRQQYFATLINTARPEETLREEYKRAMQFLYDKEVSCRKSAQPQRCVADLYQTRGHSSDTAPTASKVVTGALERLSSRTSTKIRQVLIIGPGTDFAPRTNLSDAVQPQVYQPQEIGGALQSRGLSGEPFTVDCADINPRVVRYAAPSCAKVFKMNVVTERPDSNPGYDLIVATNVLLYMNTRELLLAFHNVRSMLAVGGLFVHNDARFEANLFGKAAGLPVTDVGTVILDPRRTPVLLDRFVIHTPRIQ